MRTQPLVTVVTACYKHEPYLDDYFNGLLSQTYDHVELIFIDDGSPDGTWAKAQQYEPALRAKFPRVIMETQANQGPHAVIQRGVGMATGDLVCFLESDDYYYPTKIEENVSYLQGHPDVGLVHSDVDYLYEDRLVQAWKSTNGRRIPTGDVFAELLLRNFVTGCTVCLKRDLLVHHGRLQLYQSRGYMAGDHPLWLDVARHTKFGYIPKSLSCYRIRGDSASARRNPESELRFTRSCVDIQYDSAMEHLGRSMPPDVRAELRKKLAGVAYWLRESGQHAQAARYLWRRFRVTGPDWGLLADAAKLLPHWFWQQLTRRPPRYPENVSSTVAHAYAD